MVGDQCPTCDHIFGIHNQVWACQTCNSSKGAKGLYEFYRAQFPEDPKFYDLIPPLLEKKYLKNIYYCHDCAGTLASGGFGYSSGLTVLDIDGVLRIEREF